jgi:hypothetical protein
VKKLVNRAIWIGVCVPLLFFALLELNLGDETAACGAGRRNIIQHRGVEHCVSDFWAFVDALILPWLALIFVMILLANFAPRLNQWLNDKGQ